MVAGVLGVVFFILNVIFAFVLLVLVLIAIGYALFSKNPEVRYEISFKPFIFLYNTVLTCSHQVHYD